MVDEKTLKNREYCKRWREKNKEYDALRKKLYIENNRDRVNEKQKEYRAEREEWTKECHKRYRTNRTIESSLLGSAKGRAKKKGMPFDLKLEDIIIPDICPVLGIPLYKSDTGAHCDNSPTLDRIENSKGYTKDNVMIISHKANALKGANTLETLELVANYIRKASAYDSRVEPESPGAELTSRE